MAPAADANLTKILPAVDVPLTEIEVASERVRVTCTSNNGEFEMQMTELRLRIFGILCLGAAVGLVLLSRTGAVEAYAWVVVAGSLVALTLALVAFVLARRSDREGDLDQERSSGRSGVAVTAMVTAAALAAGLILGYGVRPSSGDESAEGTDSSQTSVALADQGAPDVSSYQGAMAVTFKDADITDAQTEEIATAVAETVSLLEDVSSSEEAEALDVVAELNYAPHSGLKMDLDAAAVANFDGATVVNVPLIVDDADAAPLNYVAFLIDGDTVSTDEVTLSLPTSSLAQYQRWTDGIQTLNTVVDLQQATDDSGMVVQAGMNWRVLNDCLVNDLGIHQAVVIGLGLICSAACAVSAGWGCIGCVTFAVGFYGGGVAGCVQRAWQ